MATIVLSGTRGPWLFLVIREGLGSAVRLAARSTQRLTNQLRLALEPECLENPHAHLAEFDGANVSAVNVRAFCKRLLGQSQSLPLLGSG